MYYTTGFCSGEIKELCALVAEIQSSIPVKDRREWPPILGLGNSMVVALTYLRRNRVQCELAEAQRELRELRMENEFLKKAAAYFARDPR